MRRNRRTGVWRIVLAASACAGPLLAGSAAQPAAAPPPALPVEAPALRLNPTGRTLALIVDLREGSRHLGEVSLRIAPDDAISAQRDQLATASAPLLRADSLERLRGLPAAGGFIGLAALRDAGFDYSFDAGAMQLRFVPAPEQRPRGAIRIGPGLAREPASASVSPARISGYLNLRAAADHIADSPAGPGGLRPPRADFEGALRWRSVVLESEATYDGARAYAPGPDGADSIAGLGFTRRGTRLLYDRPDDALRLQAGDIDPPVTGIQRGSDMLGVSLEHSLRKLRPGENIRPTGKRSFRLARPSTVKIEMNGVAVRQLRLDPGEYDLDDLPLRAGANDIRLLITDDVGEQRTLDFTSYFDASLLAEGVHEWGLAAGVLSYFDGVALAYDFSRPIASGFYRRGLTPELTAAVHLQADSAAVMTGASLHWANALGLWAVEGALSLHDGTAAGAFAEIDWEMLRPRDSQDRLSLSAQLRTADFVRPGDHGAGEPRWLNLLATYSTPLALGIHASLSGRYGFASQRARHDEGPDDLYGIGLGLSTSLRPSLGLSAALSYSSDSLDSLSPSFDDGGGELRASLRLSWRPDIHSRISVGYDTADSAASVSASRAWRSGVDEWRTSIETVYDDGARDLAVDAHVQYAGNRAVAGISHTASLDLRALETDGRPVTDQRTVFHVGAAIAFADGRVAFGPPIAGSSGFAIVAPHHSLGERRVVLGDRDRPRAYSDGFGPALVGSLPSYQRTRLAYDVDALPVGYDLGAREFDLEAPYKAGYALEVGSEYSISAFGTLLDTQGAPVALVSGTATPATGDGPSVMVFTNGAGRFGAQGLAPGRWRIEMASEPARSFILDIPADASGLYRAGALMPAEEEG